MNRASQWDDDYNHNYFRRLNEGPRSAGLVKIFDKLDIFLFWFESDENYDKCILRILNVTSSQ